MDLDINLWSSILLWNILPSTITNFLQSRYYSWKYSANSPAIPKPGSTRHQRDRGWIYLFVVLGYLAFTLYQVFICHWTYGWTLT